MLFVHGWNGNASDGDALVAYFTQNTSHPAYSLARPGPNGLESNDNYLNAATIREAVNFVRWTTGARCAGTGTRAA